jgi:predicted HTH domain antitoxin
MSITFEIPDWVEATLRREWGDLDRAAKEAFSVEAFRAGKLSLGQFAELMGMGTYEADGYLKAHGVFLDLSEAELAEEREMLGKISGE